MKIAIPLENSQVHPHLDQAKEFKIYDVSFDEILSSEIVSPDNSSTESLADFMTGHNVNVVICGALRVSAVIALQNIQIQVLGGASGNADSRVEDFLGGTLHFDRDGGSSGCGASCVLAHADGDGSDAECDGNISACGHWCH